MAAAANENKADEAIEYDGPWIERRIEWKCPDRKQHDVVLFGSWNRFRGGDELEYQGKQIYAVTAKLPLGNYVYRFMIDGEEWETSNSTAKTVKDGIEYNTVTVKMASDSDDEDEDEDNEDAGDDAGDKGATQDNNTQLIFDEKQQKFVVGKKRKGKRRGRPSMELDLGADFENEDADDEDTTDKTGDDTAATSNAETDNEAGDASSKKKGKKKKKKTKKYTGKGNVDVQKEKEWARYVFVQQLRQQQQHNDEINRVKTLWKQERQVRVEMHKKVVKEKKKIQKDLVAAKAEIERLEKLNQISTDADTKLAVQLENDKKQLTADLEKARDDLKKAREEMAETRKQKVEAEKSTRDHDSEFDTERKKLQSEQQALEAQVLSLKSQNESLQANLDAFKSGNTKTMDYQKQQYEDMQKRYEDERAETTKLKEDVKKYKAQLSEQATKLQETEGQLSASNNKCSTETQRVKQLEKRIEKLKGDYSELKSSNEAADKIKVEVEKAKQEAESEKTILNDKIKGLNEKLDQLKDEHAKELESVKNQAKADMDALAAKSDTEMSGHLANLKKEQETRDETIKTQKSRIDELESQLSEEKTNSDTLDKKLASLTETHAALTKDKESADKEIATMKDEIEKLQNELSTAQSDASAASDTQKTQIENLEKEVAAVKEQLANDTKDFEAQNSKLSAQVETLTEEVSKKGNETTEISAKLTEREQELASCKSSEAAKQTQIESLEKQLASEKEDAASKLGDYQKQIEDLSGQVETVRSEKDARIGELEDDITKVRAEMSDKLKEFHNAETKIAEMESSIEAQKKQFEIEKGEYEAQLAATQEKDERIQASCKKLNEQFEGIRTEMKSIKELKIAQLEEMVNAFQEFSPVLTKVFKFNQALVDDLMQKYKRELTLRRKYFNIVQDLRGNIRVFCRVRPILPFEIKKGDTSCLKFPEPGKIVVTDEKDAKHNFEFDQVYAPGTSQEAVSEDTTEYVQSVMDGYNVSIFAYGQTGSGKTYTMDGSQEEPGVNLRALKHLFKMAEERAPQFEYKIKVAIFEIYNEEIRDLIPKKSKKGKKDNKKQDKRDFKVMHLPDGSVEVQGLNWVSVKTETDVINLSNIAKETRTAAVTDMNAHSSRSHMLLVVDVRGFNLPANIEYLGRLYLVDLAGSERVKKSGATGQALKEAQNINKSLAALGDVMQSLQKKDKFIPYRNSTLTDLMANSLGGNAKTVMFINCCPTARHAFETVSSLKFASRVGKVELGQAKAKQSKKKNKS